MITAPHIHAMVIHFPIALLLVGFVSETIALFTKNDFYNKVSLLLLLLGAAGTIVAFVSGSYAGDGMTDGILLQPLEMHEDAAVITLWLAIIAAIYKTAVYYFDYQKI